MKRLLLLLTVAAHAACVQRLAHHRRSFPQELDKPQPSALLMLSAQGCGHCINAYRAIDGLSLGDTVDVILYNSSVSYRDKMNERYGGRLAFRLADESEYRPSYYPQYFYRTGSEVRWYRTLSGELEARLSSSPDAPGDRRRGLRRAATSARDVDAGEVVDR